MSLSIHEACEMQPEERRAQLGALVRELAPLVPAETIPAIIEALSAAYGYGIDAGFRLQTAAKGKARAR